MSVIDEVKNRIDLVEVVNSYVELKKSGRNYKALCPFHAENTPSFVVFPDSQRWHCFGGCSEGGDVFSFVMKQEGWDFRTALEELAKRAGVELRPQTPAEIEAQEEADRLREILGKAADYYHHLLKHAPEAEEARAYVEERALNEETAETFLLGYALPGWDHTRSYLTEQGCSVDELVKAGLLVRKEETGSVYDRFRDRLMIPIRDLKGRVIGFGARTLDPEGVPKYLNSPQTMVFDKSNTLFGMDLARKAIRRQDQVVIAEGYMDVMQARQAGFTNVIAQMGTALTETQLRQIQRYTKHLVLALDPDAAGINATLRGVEVAQESLDQEWTPVFNPRGLVGYEARMGASIRVLRLPPGKDPDDLIRQEPERWAELVEHAVSVVDFYLQILMEGLDLEDTQAKAEVVDSLLPVLRAVTNPVEREDYVQKVARALRLDSRSVLARLHQTGDRPIRRRSRPGYQSHRPLDRTAQPQRKVEADLEAHCISLFLRRPGLFERVNDMLVEGKVEPIRDQDFESTLNRTIFQAWREAWLSEEEDDLPQTLRQHLPDDLHPQLERLLASDEADSTEEDLTRDVIRTILRLRERHLKRRGQELSFLALEAQEAGDMRAAEYVDALQSYRETLLRTQKALAQRWG